MADATTTDSAHSKEGHHHGTKSYWIVWIILLTCTGLTVYTGHYVDMKGANIIVALVIATIKASLVIWYFMHMRDAAGTNRIVFITSFVFMLVMIFGVFGDLWTRNEMSLPSSAPSTLAPEIRVPGEAPAHHE